MRREIGEMRRRQPRQVSATGWPAVHTATYKLCPCSHGNVHPFCRGSCRRIAPSVILLDRLGCRGAPCSRGRLQIPHALAGRDLLRMLQVEESFSSSPNQSCLHITGASYDKCTDQPLRLFSLKRVQTCSYSFGNTIDARLTVVHPDLAVASASDAHPNLSVRFALSPSVCSKSAGHSTGAIFLRTSYKAFLVQCLQEKYLLCGVLWLMSYSLVTAIAKICARSCLADSWCKRARRCAGSVHFRNLILILSEIVCRLHSRGACNARLLHGACGLPNICGEYRSTGPSHPLWFLDRKSSNPDMIAPMAPTTSSDTRPHIPVAPLVSSIWPGRVARPTP